MKDSLTANARRSSPSCPFFRTSGLLISFTQKPTACHYTQNIHSTIHSFNEYLLRIYYVPVTELCSGEKLLTKEIRFLPSPAQGLLCILERLPKSKCGWIFSHREHSMQGFLEPTIFSVCSVTLLLDKMNNGSTN